MSDEANAAYLAEYGQRVLGLFRAEHGDAADALVRPEDPRHEEARALWVQFVRPPERMRNTKYFALEPRFEKKMPAGSAILQVSGNCTIPPSMTIEYDYAAVEQGRYETRRFRVFWDGQPCPMPEAGFVARFDRDGLMWHLYEEASDDVPEVQESP